MTKTAGSPFNVTVNGNPSNSGQTDRPNIVGNPYAPTGGQNKAHFLNVAAFQANTAYTYGNMQRDSMVGPRYTDVDSSLSKVVTMFNVKDQPVNLQLRWDIFNIANHPNYNIPGTTLGTGTFGQLTSDVAARQMQIAAKIIF
jgi:hypothetical protein